MQDQVGDLYFAACTVGKSNPVNFFKNRVRLLIIGEVKGLTVWQDASAGLVGHAKHQHPLHDLQIEGKILAILL